MRRSLPQGRSGASAAILASTAARWSASSLRRPASCRHDERPKDQQKEQPRPPPVGGAAGQSQAPQGASQGRAAAGARPRRDRPTIPPELARTSRQLDRAVSCGGLAYAGAPVPERRRALPERGRGMDRIRIVGGQPLNGTIPISGAKNATLPLMIASLLTDQTLILDNVPRLADVGLLQRILGNHGVDVMVGGKRPGETQYDGQTLHISAARIVDTTAPYELVSSMRASFWVIAPLVARMGEAKVSMPGGCAIGTRPVDLLIMALERLGADIEIDGGYVIARAKNGLQGRRDQVSQGHGRRHPHRADGGLARPRHHRDRERGARARDHRRRRLPQQDGREDHRRRHLADRGRGRAQAARRAPPRAARPHRDRHLCDGGRDDRRRRDAGERARRSCCSPALDVLAQRGRRDTTTTNRGMRVARNGARHRAGRGDDRAVPRLSRPTCRRS